MITIYFVNKKYICDKDEVYGIYGGLNLQNMFSTTTQMPNMIEVISNKGYYKIRSCRCKLEDGTECSLEDIYTKYYPTYNNGLSEKDLLDAIEKLVKDRRKNSVIYTIK